MERFVCGGVWGTHNSEEMGREGEQGKVEVRVRGIEDGVLREEEKGCRWPHETR